MTMSSSWPATASAPSRSSRCWPNTPVAYVVLKDGAAGGEELTAELQRLVKDRYAAHAYPRRISYVTELPKTPSGKLQRFILREKESLQD